ncbi:MAG: hypothetical protein LJE95_05675 [Acidobacteria bacterium]|nr:hypothetical protein [Acidobacteriota bacterium]
MIDFERNLDAYRILAEILSDMRAAIQRELESRHGSDWFRTGLPEGVLDRLIERKEKEKAIDWYESEYQQLIDFATFFDLLEILESDSELIPYLRALAPSAPLLHARMLELDVMRDKLSLARSISENELVFLGTFHLRFRQALQHQREAVEAKGSGEKDHESVAEKPEKKDDDEAKEPATKEESRDEEPVDINVARARAKEARAASGGTANSSKASRPTPPLQPVKAASGGSQPTPEPVPDPVPEPAIAPLSQAMDNNNHREVLRALYREVTSIAEGLWGSSVPPAPSVWEKVRVHPWYEGNFSALGLKPLSDFYDIAAKVRERMSNGIARDELQEFLKEHSFANVLLALRDMFQKNGI